MYFNQPRLDSLERLYGTNNLVQQNLAGFTGNYKTGNYSNTYSIIHGIEDAKSYPVVPNSTCILFDDEQSIFYKKTVDSMGVTDLRAFEYSEKVMESSSPAISEKTEIDSLKAEISELKALICREMTKNDEKTSKKSEKEVKNDEINIQ